MNRQEVILQQLKIETALFLKDSDHLMTDAQTLSSKTGIARYNVSRELNELVKKGTVLKINGRPVFFFSKEVIAQKLHLNTDQTFDTLDDLRDFISKPQQLFTDDYPFDSLIGYDGSLSNAVKQAKAALLYPPNGLHTLITGPSGSGKTTFATFMHQYAIHNKHLSEEAPYVVFNCADYSNNSQLLLDHLFGHKKHAFTGAETDKAGLIEAADGGILFLDEIHRLPPEGQEMLFSVIDHGSFYRLGDSSQPQTVDVLIIGATTENIHHAMLTTFLRRIPLVIRLPALNERSLSEKVQLIHFCMQKEAERINRPLLVNEDVIRFFVQYTPPGNIGQLRNDIQLLCANALVDNLHTHSEKIQVKLSHLSAYLIDQLYYPEPEKGTEFDLKEKLNMIQISELTFWPNSRMKSDPFVLVEGQTISDDIIEVYQKYMGNETGLSSLKEIIQSKSENLMHAEKRLEQPIYKIVSKEKYNAIVAIITRAAQANNYQLSVRNVKNLALHLDTLVEKISEGYQFRERDFSTYTEKNQSLLGVEFYIADEICAALESTFKIELPKNEKYFISLYLKAMNEKVDQRKIGILILMHGESAAIDLAKTANCLLDVDHAVGLSMPLSQSVGDALEIAVKKAIEINQGKGILCLSDMGSLNMFGDLIFKKTGIPTKTIKMVTTPIAIEATRKSLLPEMTLERLVQDIEEQSLFVGNSVTDIPEKEMTREDESLLSRKDKILFVLKESLIFLEPDQIYDVLLLKAKEIDRKFALSNFDEFWIKFLFHTSSLIERAIRKEQFSRETSAAVLSADKELTLFLRELFVSVENRYAIKISDGELSYLVELIHLNLQ